MLTTLLFIILKNFLNKRQASYIKFTELVFFESSSFVCVDKNFFISLLLFSQKSCKNLNSLHMAF